MSQSAPRRHPPSGGNTEVMSAKFGDTEWEARESQRQRELEEARARAAQMEKTMKWWSDCTANWREKWSKVRTERNKAREESKQLRSSLEAAIKESNSYKREKCELEIQITQLKKEMEKVHMLMMKHAGQFNKSSLDGADEPERDGRDNNCSPDISSDGLKNVNSEDGLVTKVTTNVPDDSGQDDLDIEEYILQGGAMPKHSVEFKDKSEQMAEERRLIQQLSKDDYDEDYLLQKIAMLQLRLDDTQKTIQIERDEKNSIHKSFEKFRQEMQELRDKCEELRAAKQEAVRELLTLQEQHRVEMRITNNSLQEEVAARETLERRLCELRTELERMQAENAAEWGKRERLETEKLNLERENKKLRSECQDLQERLERKGRPPVNNSDTEFRALQQELLDKNKEITDIRHSHSKMKKLLSEANTELGHAVRRAEQYETEVKRLRSRVEELKRELAGAEDELDSACNHVRRLQRTNEELTGQTEGLQVQIQHLQTSPKNLQDLGNFKATNKSNFTSNSNYKPNINDLKQLFDNSCHYERQMQPKSRGGANDTQVPILSGSYYDAKPSYIDGDGPYDAKDKSSDNMFDFERAKQKFDNISRSSGGGGGGGGVSNMNSKRPPSNMGGGGNFFKLHPSASPAISGIPKRQSSSTISGSGSNTNNSSSCAGSYFDGNNFSGSFGEDTTPLLSKQTSVINETIQFFDNDGPQSQRVCVGGGGGVGGKLNIAKVNNINLDGLKMSEDDETP
ncbi:coiled-coil domain-containing protein 102A isoform X2 [Toxorhynchites rutilus septentrionalis]|uniref:coiled-coil domain-containing protein 102A isoform X2 n=1 Tax=Toxorhynchites rutilus septentrionalis TaxID=329112 RepID=UPI00247AFFBA|nr:coiled-coil domain-containing protein 102A isoform X2 [Toxorhynchites rutilus septentrionalis]